MFHKPNRVASLCKEWNLQKKENERKMKGKLVDFAEVWNLQGNRFASCK